MTLRTRKPTGDVPYPLLLVEGPEKTGKSCLARVLSASERVGRSFVFDVGEVPSDQYAPLGRYEIVETDGSWSDFIGQLAEVVKVPQEDGKPNVCVIDTGTAVWQFLSEWADQRARAGRKAQAILREDPDAEIDIPMNLWTDAKDRWGRMVGLLRAWNGIGVIVCRASEKAKVHNGVPVAGQTEYKIEAEKSLPFVVTAHVRMVGFRVPQLVGITSLHMQGTKMPVELPADGTLEHLIFDVIGAGGGGFKQVSVPKLDGIPIAEAKGRVLETATRAGWAGDGATKAASAAWAEAGLADAQGAVTPDELLAAIRAVVPPADDGAPFDTDGERAPKPPERPVVGLMRNPGDSAEAADASLAAKAAQEAATVPIPPCEADAADGAEKAPGGHTEADPGIPALLPGEPVAAGDWRGWVAKIDKPTAVRWLVARELPTNGSLSVLQQRMIEHANLRGQAETVAAV